MTAEPTPLERHRDRLRTAALVAMALAMVAMGGSAATCAYHAAKKPEDSSKTTVIRSTPSVVTSIRDLARLESTSFHIERIIDLKDRHERFFGLVSSEDAILLVAAGDVSAGVDLTQLRDGDVVLYPDDKRVVITLPPPEVLSVRIDNEGTYVYERRTDLLSRRREDLETRARQEAESTLRAAALKAGILDRAKKNSAHTLEALARSLDYDRVEIRWRAE